MKLDQQIAVVTGVSKGVGLEVVKLLNAKGTIVAGWGRTAPAYSHPNFHFFSCDVSIEDQVEKAYQATISKLGTDIRILVNNAGVNTRGYFKDITNEEVREMAIVNTYPYTITTSTEVAFSVTFTTTTTTTP
jgi:NAD(P)-dependent dehydrogenase (short-subunit alcohol dehydrogenase family)